MIALLGVVTVMTVMQVKVLEMAQMYVLMNVQKSLQLTVKVLQLL
jgi:hypothetical protein